MIGYDVVWKALRNIRRGQIFDENFLMMIATFGAFGVQDYMEAVAVMLFYQIGELFQSYAVGKSRQSITDMMDICPEYANVEENGELVEVDPDDVEVGSVIVVKPGERIPLDGVVIEGESMIDTAALTGESVPRRVCPGEEIISGCINGSSTIKVQVTKLFEDSTVTKILELVENASSKKARIENFITRFAKYYTPVVTILALILAVVPPLLFGQNWGEWVKRACTFLVISCPCALVISVPLGFFGGIGAASKKGIMVKGSNYLEAVSKIHTIVFDKTGTLTKGEFKVSKVTGVQCNEEKLLELAAYAECYSNHPIANSILEEFQKKHSIVRERVSLEEEIAGHGIRATMDGIELLAGNGKLMKQKKITYTEVESFGTVVYVAYDGLFMGSIVISDEIKDGVKKAISELNDRDRLIITLRFGLETGNEKTQKEVADKLGISQSYISRLEKKIISRLLK